MPATLPGDAFADTITLAPTGRVPQAGDEASGVALQAGYAHAPWCRGDDEAPSLPSRPWFEGRLRA